MIIDLILDRKDNENDISNGYTHYRNGITGEIKEIPAYNPRTFYFEMLSYGGYGEDISMAMDYGTEEEVKKALCSYIDGCDYNPEIKEYINSVNWI